VIKAIKARQPPNREYETKNARHIYLIGKVAEGPEIDLKSVRRPAFFAAEPWNEPIAAADSRTWVVEFTAPREPYERIHKKMTDPIKLRGWYLRGDGVDDGKGGPAARAPRHERRGRNAHHGDHRSPRSHVPDRCERQDALHSRPERDEWCSGQHFWRAKALAFNQAGFDVLLFDRRGVGISGGYSDTNTHQQGRDLLAIVASLRTGEGLRAMNPAARPARAGRRRKTSAALRPPRACL
jgi:hypothetical protein